MAKLPTFTLEYDEKRRQWELQNDQTDKVVKRWETKDDATARGALKGAVGAEGGSVRIQKTNGQYQEERTFPRSRDPRESKG
jgi:hypothetical protein